MEVTPELLVLLKELLNLCGEDAKRTHETEQIRERMQNVVMLIRLTSRFLLLRWQHIVSGKGYWQTLKQTRIFVKIHNMDMLVSMCSLYTIGKKENITTKLYARCLKLVYRSWL